MRIPENMQESVRKNGSYGPDTLDKVRNGADCTKIVGRNVKLRRADAVTFVGRCPKCGRDTLIVRKDMYMCANEKCDMAGDALTWLMRGRNMSLNEAADFIIEENGIQLVPGNLKAGFRRPAAAAKACEKAVEHFQKCLPGSAGEAYLAKRGLSTEAIRKFRLGFDSGSPIPDADQEGLLLGGVFASGERGIYDRFRGRVIFPVFDEDDDMIIGMGGRILDDSKEAAKYINSPATVLFDKGHHLYGMNFAGKSSRTGIILCEGYMDVIAMHSAGFDSAVAALGTALTPYNARAIRRHTDSVCLMFDSDEAGRKATMKAIRVLEDTGIGIYTASLPGAKDPDEFIRKFGRDAMQKRLSSCLKAEDFIVISSLKDFAPGSPEASAALSEVFDTLSLPMLEKCVQSYARMKASPVFFEKMKKRYGL